MTYARGTDFSVVERAHHRRNGTEQQREVRVPQADRPRRVHEPDRLLRSRGRGDARSVLHVRAGEALNRRIQTKFTAVESYGQRSVVMDRVVDNGSSFTQDLTRIGWICRSLRDRSILCIDEFGKGTAPQGTEKCEE